MRPAQAPILLWLEPLYSWQVDTGKPITGGSPPALEVRLGYDGSLPAGHSYEIGRDPQCDIVVTDARVSWHHAVLRTENGRWVLVDNGSTNGTYPAAGA